MNTATRRSLRDTVQLSVLGAALCFAALHGAVAQADPITPMSTNGTSTGNNVSGEPRFDRNGRFAAFVSKAQNLIPGQNTGGNAGVFLYDRLAGTLKLVSHVPGQPLTGGNQGIAQDTAPNISADGKWIAYSSASTDLVSGQVDANATNDVFLWSRETDTTQLVSHASDSATTAAGLESKLAPVDNSISANGNFVVYFSAAVNLIPNQVGNGFFQIYQFDRFFGTNRLVSHSANSFLQSGNGESITGSNTDGRNVSADGRFVVFASRATNLISAVTDTNNTADIFLWDRLFLLENLILLSRRAGFPLTTGNQSSFEPTISADGTGIAFTSAASDLEGVTSDTNLSPDVFHYDRVDDVLTLVSRAARDITTTGDEGAEDPSIGADGDCVAFRSQATDLVLLQNDSNNAFDTFFWRGGPMVLMSHLPGLPKQTGTGECSKAIVAADCSGVAFESNSNDLVAGVADTNNTSDIFYRPRNRAEVFLLSHVPNETATGNDTSVLRSLAVAGALVSFESDAENLVAGDANGDRDVFFHGSLIMADGFETGDFSAWSQHRTLGYPRAKIHACTARWGYPRAKIHACIAHWGYPRAPIQACTARWGYPRARIHACTARWGSPRTPFHACTARWGSSRAKIHACTARWGYPRAKIHACTARWGCPRTPVHPCTDP